MLETWAKGYTQTELDAAQEKFGLVFPTDLIAFYLERRPVKGHDWRDDAAIRKMLAWPFEVLRFDIENNDLWWLEWGPKPFAAEGREQVLRQVLAQAPQLIPLYGHRFLPETPAESGNPVFSVYGSDTIIYGANLEDYFQREFASSGNEPSPGDVKHIPFWSDLVARNQ